MTTLFIKSIMEHDMARLEMLSIILCAMYLCVLFAIIIDLFFGVRRARRLKIDRTSYGFRRTITKTTTYYGLMMLFTLADVIASIISPLPFFTALGAIGIVIVEGKSVFEKVKDENKQIEDIPAVLVEIIKNKDNIQDLISWLNNQTQKKDDTERFCNEFSPTRPEY